MGGLSRLAIWWIKLGITPDRIEPGKPEQNGRHERFHKTLKGETASPPASNPAAQQRRFDRFLREYNTERPHEALDNQTPAALYTASSRTYRRELPEIEYPTSYLVRSVHTAGTIKWKGRRIWLNDTLVGERVGLEPIDDDRWLIRFSTIPLAVLDNRLRTPAIIRV